MTPAGAQKRAQGDVAPWPDDDPAVEWLLQSAEPAIRYRTLTEVLGRPESDADVVRARAAIPEGPKVSEIFAAQRPDGGWGSLRHGHKYTGTAHVLKVLHELRVPPGDRRLPPVVDLLGPPLRPSLEVIEGLVRWHMGADAARLSLLCWFDAADDRRAREIVEFMAEAQWPDGGWNCDKNPLARHSSFMETVGATRALFDYYERTGEERARRLAIASSDIFIKRGVIRSQRTGNLVSGRITQLHWPRDYDMLWALEAIAPGGLDDKRLDEALDLLEAKRRRDGHWVANGPKPKVVREGPGEVADFCDGTRDQMVTLRALTVLRAAHRRPTLKRDARSARRAAPLRRTRRDLLAGLLGDAARDAEVRRVEMLKKDDDGTHERLYLSDGSTVLLRRYATTGGEADLYRAKEGLLYSTLQRAGLPTPQILASVAGSKGAGGDAAAALLSDHGGRPLSQLFLSVEGRQRAGLWAAVGGALRQLHGADLAVVWPFPTKPNPGVATAANLLKVVRRVRDAGLAPDSAVEAITELRPHLRAYFNGRPTRFLSGGLSSSLPQLLLERDDSQWHVTTWLGWGLSAGPGDPAKEVTAINRTVREWSGSDLPTAFYTAYGSRPNRVCEIVYDLLWLLHVAPLYAKGSTRSLRPPHTRALDATANLSDTIAELARLLHSE